MSFQPVHTSSPPKPLDIEKIAAIAAEISRSSATPVPELIGLTPQDVRIIDAVIERAAPSATTFLAIFKAYNDILQEHGLDPHEVTYYGKLLKLGTLRGKTWGEKWRTAKLQYGYVDDYESSDVQQTVHYSPPKRKAVLPSTKFLTPIDKHFTISRRDDDSFTLHSHEDGSEFPRSDTDTGFDATQPHHSAFPILRQPSLSVPSITNSLGLEAGIPDHHARVVIPHTYEVLPIPDRKTPDWDSATSEDRLTVPTLPSYRAAVRDTPPFLLPRPPSKRDRLLASPVLTPSAARQAIAQARERRGSVVNEEDAWRKIKISQDEKEADRFREDKLVERCWDVWSQSFHWIHVCRPTFFFSAEISVISDNERTSWGSKRLPHRPFKPPSLA